MATAVRQGRTFAIVFVDGQPADFAGAAGRTLGPAHRLASEYSAVRIVTDPHSARSWDSSSFELVDRPTLLAHFGVTTTAQLCRQLTDSPQLRRLAPTSGLPGRAAAQRASARLPLFTAGLGFAALGTHPSPYDPQTNTR